MNKQELIKEFKKIGIYNLNIFGSEIEGIPTKSAIALIEQLDEPETGHADEAPRYVKNILARLRELPLHDREVWLKAIMDEFEQDFSSAKWREGYEQGKFEGKYIPEKVVVPQFVAEWIEQCKAKGKRLLTALLYTPGEVNSWVDDPDNQETFALAWMFGYTIKKEKLYFVSLKGVYHGDLGYADNFNGYSFYNKDRNLSGIKYKHTRKELEKAGFGWVFDCPGVEVEEVE